MAVRMIGVSVCKIVANLSVQRATEAKKINVPPPNIFIGCTFMLHFLLRFGFFPSNFGPE